MSLDESRLTEIGTAFLRVVRARWPELEDFASLSEYDELTIECPSPHTAHAPVLWISADVHTDEVIIAFAGGHSSGGPWDEPESADFEFRSSIKFIDGILSEAVVGCVLKSGGAIGYLDYLKEEDYWSEVQSVRSWKGMHDADYV
ncbi:MAG: hypothetical protein ACI9EF_001409 [Pseudohongiellaceae bacterium]|jgi:hypothetical protein